MNVTTKSGGNRFHGVAYDFLQNDAMNARGYFASSLPPVRYNLFGANIGGPILKNKVFAFFDYSGLRNKQSYAAQALVPTLAERGCLDSSNAVCDFTATGTVLYDPSTYSAATGASRSFSDVSGVNGIPSNRVDPFARLWIRNYPAPNIATRADGSNYVANVSNSVTYDQYLGRVDYTISSKQTLFGTVARIVGVSTNNTIVPNLFGTSYPNQGTNASIEHTFVISPKLVNVARFGYNRTFYFISQQGVASKNYAAEYGINNLFADPSEYAPPAIGINNFTSFGTSYTPQGDIQNRFQYADEITYALGKHTIVAGAEYIRTQFKGTWVNNDNGQFSFDGRFTSAYAGGVRSSTLQGNALADFILGYPNNSQGAVGSSVANFRETNIAGYLQDDWRITSTLILNLGIRYAFDNPPLAIGGHSYLVSLETGASRSGTWNTNYRDFSPRVGFAWSPRKTVAVHGGYGIYYTSFPYNDLQFLVLNPPNHVAQSPTFNITNPTLIENSLAPTVPLSGAAGFTFSPVAKDPSVQEFNLSVEQRIGTNVVASTSYVGNVGRHIGVWTRPNQPIAVAPGDPSGMLSVVPHPVIGNILGWENSQSTNYHGLLAKVSGSTKDLQVLAGYTFSKSMNLVDGDGNVYEQYSNPRLNYAVAGFDRTHQFVASGTYQVPIGPGKRFFTTSNVFSKEVLGGWQVGTIFRLATGLPVSVYANNETDNSGSPMFANRVCDPRSGAKRTKEQFFNTACFTQPAVGTYGRGGRDSVRGPRQNQIDLSAAKVFAISGSHQLQFRAEAFNALNHSQLSLSATSLTSGALGVLNQAASSRTVQVGLRYSF